MVVHRLKFGHDNVKGFLILDLLTSPGNFILIQHAESPVGFFADWTFSVNCGLQIEK